MELILQQSKNKYSILSIPMENPVIGIYLFTKNERRRRRRKADEVTVRCILSSVLNLTTNYFTVGYILFAVRIKK